MLIETYQAMTGQDLKILSAMWSCDGIQGLIIKYCHCIRSTLARLQLTSPIFLLEWHLETRILLEYSLLKNVHPQYLAVERETSPYRSRRKITVVLVKLFRK